MARMKRLQISIEPELDAAVARRAEEEGLSKAEVIRRCVREESEGRCRRSRRKPLFKLCGSPVRQRPRRQPARSTRSSDRARNRPRLDLRRHIDSLDRRRMDDRDPGATRRRCQLLRARLPADASSPPTTIRGADLDLRSAASCWHRSRPSNSWTRVGGTGPVMSTVTHGSRRASRGSRGPAPAPPARRARVLVCGRHQLRLHAVQGDRRGTRLRRRLRRGRLRRTAALHEDEFPSSGRVTQQTTRADEGGVKPGSMFAGRRRKGTDGRGVAGRDPAVPLRHLWAVHIKTQPYAKIKSQLKFSSQSWLKTLCSERIAPTIRSL